MLANIRKGITLAQLNANLADIHVQRLNYMDQDAVDYSSYSRLHFLPLRTTLELGGEFPPSPNPRFFCDISPFFDISR